MRKKFFTNFFLLAMLILFATFSLQAQNWLVNQSTMMHTNLSVELSAQKVKPYKDIYLVGISKKADSLRYCFSLFRNNNINVYNSFLSANDITINDFTILGNTLYFCGNRQMNLNQKMGILGKFSMIDFMDDGNFNYDFLYLSNIDNLTKLVAFDSGVDTISIVAIGHDTLNGLNPGRIVKLNFNANGSVINCSKIDCPYISNTHKEIMHDIYISDQEIMTVSHIYPINRYIVRCFTKTHLGVNIGNTIYSFPNLDFNVSSEIYGFPLHLANISEDTIAVSVSAREGTKNFTMVNFLKKNSTPVFRTHLIYHEDKSNEVLEMEYYPGYKDLLVLNNSYHSGYGMIQTMTHLSPDSTTDYLSVQDIFSSPNQLNHFSLISNKRYAVAGVYPTFQGHNLQMITVKEIQPLDNNCVNKYSKKIYQTIVPDGNWNANQLPYFNQQFSWGYGTATNNGNTISVYCYD
ncbi:MAG: hypothetical protein U0L53_05255 [Bacteroidales bacterium]|nr:hypothetical protein [Bacteroidales bacterium]